MAKQRSVLIHNAISKTVANPESILAMTPETDKNVTGTFVNVECPGQPARICAKYYKKMPYFEKTFIDNEKATIPLSVARWINEECFTQQHTNILDEAGNPTKGLKKIPRYKFLVENY